MRITTLHDVTRLAGLDVLDHLDRQVTVPVIAGVQAQGDVIVIPAGGVAPATAPLPAAGVPVVRGEAGGNTHHLVADGPSCFDPAEAGAQTVGTLTVPTGSTAYLIHPEHGATGVAPGTYVVRRQREQAEEQRLVAD